MEPEDDGLEDDFPAEIFFCTSLKIKKPFLVGQQFRLFS